MAWKNSSRNIGRYSNDCIIEGKEILYRLKETEGEREKEWERGELSPEFLWLLVL